MIFRCFGYEVLVNRRMVNSTPGLVLVLALITLIGGLIFQKIESPHEQHTRIHVSKIRQKIFVLAQQLAKKGSNADWSKLVAQVDRYRDKLLASWEAGTDELTIDIPNKWSIWGSIYYCFTVFTTIGFGDIFVTTTLGKLLTVIYGLLAIPLCSLLISRISSIMVRSLKAIYLMTLDASGVPIGFRETYQRTDASYSFRVLPCLLLFCVYLLLGAVVYSYIARGQTHRWSLLDAVYFAFITTSTVGFGDLVPDTDTFFALLSLLYMIIGLAVTGIVFGRLTMIYDQFFHWIDQPVSQPAPDGKPGKDLLGRPIGRTVGKHLKHN